MAMDFGELNYRVVVDMRQLDDADRRAKQIRDSLSNGGSGGGAGDKHAALSTRSAFEAPANSAFSGSAFAPNLNSFSNNASSFINQGLDYYRRNSVSSSLMGMERGSQQDVLNTASAQAINNDFLSGLTSARRGSVFNGLTDMERKSFVDNFISGGVDSYRRNSVSSSLIDMERSDSFGRRQDVINTASAQSLNEDFLAMRSSQTSARRGSVSSSLMGMEQSEFSKSNRGVYGNRLGSILDEIDSGGGKNQLDSGTQSKMSRQVSNLHQIFVASVVARAIAGVEQVMTGLVNYRSAGAMSQTPAMELQATQGLMRTVGAIPIAGSVITSTASLISYAQTGYTQEMAQSQMNLSQQLDVNRGERLQTMASVGVERFNAIEPNTYLQSINQRRQEATLKRQGVQAGTNAARDLLQQQIGLDVSAREGQRDLATQAGVAIFSFFGADRSHDALMRSATADQATNFGIISHEGQRNLADINEAEKSANFRDMAKFNASVDAQRYIFLAGGEKLTGNTYRMMDYMAMSQKVQLQGELASIQGTDNRAAERRSLLTGTINMIDPANMQAKRSMVADIQAQNILTEAKGGSAMFSAMGQSIQAQQMENRARQAALETQFNAMPQGEPQRSVIATEISATRQENLGLAFQQQDMLNRSGVTLAHQQSSLRAAQLLSNRNPRASATEAAIGDITEQFSIYQLDQAKTADPALASSRRQIENVLLNTQAQTLISRHSRGYGVSGGAVEAMAAQSQAFAHGSRESDVVAILQAIYRFITKNGGTPLFSGGG